MRIIRACKELGIKTVVAHSEADVDSLPVRFADEAVCVGAKEAKSSYLNIPAIISAAEITNCDAIHPGYGFFSENAGFAEICESCKIKFIGPSIEHIKLMGDKVTARDTALKAGVPVVPGSDGAINHLSDAEVLKVATDVGYPLILKASAGGGGRGMRVVESKEQLLRSINIVASEAKASFGSDVIYLEKFIVNPRHIEIQLISDNHGNHAHLFERDCSIQRRHQKLIEECPSAILTPEMRKKMGETALNLARYINYNSVGTIEFLMDGETDFYFMEMNTRLQVEHPVTEMVTGIDILKEQIKVAFGRELTFKQEEAQINGHSIECRVNAEDPKNFIPSVGKVTELYFPGGPGVRVDTALYAGCEVTPYYDSLIAKIIVHAPTRQKAIHRMRRALGEFHIVGIKTTVPRLIDILMSEKFMNGDVTTRFIEDFEK